MKLSIIGTGSFGLALASRFKNVNITMWTKFEEEKICLLKIEVMISYYQV